MNADINTAATYFLRELANDLNRTLAMVRPVWAAMLTEAGDAANSTELAESIAVGFDLFVGVQIPDAVFELADLAMPASD